ncbi:MAG: DUF4080 domain-containing protein, partial [Sulfurospirillaceae bacterium]
KLYSLTQCEIQVGILKKLSGTTISRHDEEFEMVYSNKPPYEILKNKDLSFQKMQELKRFARFWDLVFNSGNFKLSCKHLWRDGKVFEGFLNFSNWLFLQTQSTWQISLERLAGYIFTYLCEVMNEDKEFVKKIMIEDLMIIRGRKLPLFLRDEVVESEKRKEPKKANIRQLKHSKSD